MRHAIINDERLQKLSVFECSKEGTPLKIREVMSTELETAAPRDSIKKAAAKMNKFHIGSLVVTAPGFEMLGIITERDILKAFVKGKKPSTEVGEIMSKGVVTIDLNSTLEDAAKKMMEYGIKRLVVTKKDECVGIVTATDLITYESRLVDKLSDLMQAPRKLMQAG